MKDGPSFIKFFFSFNLISFATLSSRFYCFIIIVLFFFCFYTICYWFLCFLSLFCGYLIDICWVLRVFSFPLTFLIMTQQNITNTYLTSIQSLIQKQISVKLTWEFVMLCVWIIFKTKIDWKINKTAHSWYFSCH